MFTEMKELNPSEKVTLGDGHDLEAVGERTVEMEMLLPNGDSRRCVLKKVLYVPKLGYNLVSVSRAAEAGKTIKFYNSSCEFVNSSGKTIAFATKQGSLYCLEFLRKSQESVNAAHTESKEKLWHRRFGHLSEQGMKKLVRKELVNLLDYDSSRDVGFCEACIGGKQHKNSFKPSETETSMPLELVHSDVCGKMGQKSLGGAEYFLTLLDDKTHYTWVYPLKGKGKGKGKGQKNCPKMGHFLGQNVPIVSLWDVLGRIPGRRGKIPGRTPHLRDASGFLGRFFYGTLSTCHNCPSFDPRPVPLTFLLKSTTVECVTAVVKFPGHWNVRWQTKISHLV